MTKEIELKAITDNHKKVKNKAEELFGNCKKIIKIDSYYKYIKSNGDNQIVRLRNENGKYTVTAKKKNVANGIETNEEIEFSINDFKNFQRYLDLTGAEPWLEKKKVGWMFETIYNNFRIIIEICEVGGLGWFTEIEIKLENPEEAKIIEAKETLYKILNLLEIPENKIEERFYSELLKNKLD